MLLICHATLSGGCATALFSEQSYLTYINILPVLVKYFFFVVVLYFRSGSHVMEKLFQGENISYCHADGEGLLIIVTS